MNYEKVLAKIKEKYPYYYADKQAQLAEMLVNVNDNLKQNVEEWADDKPLSEIWVRGKYCVRAVMQIRQDDDFVDAISALNEYAEKSSNEYLIWRPRA